ncbi:MAG: SBBP repeat-containing protein [Anaerolineales bacterium]|nr:SBBP repeat-containing protein [Anaerolineales bacterium]
MFTKNKISKMFSALFIVMFLLAGVFPAQAESLAKPLSASGDFLWAKGFGGTDLDYGRSIAVDLNGNVYTTGHFQDTVDFDPGAATFNLTSIGGTDIFISKLDSSGNFVWAKRMGSTNSDSGSQYDDSNDIALDSNGNVYVTGQFQGTADFNPGAATFNLTSVGIVDIFIVKLDTDGNFVWAKGIGGSSWDYASSIAIDSNGNVLTTGRIESASADFDPGVGIATVNTIGDGDVFISKLDTNGNFVWAKVMGSVSSEGGLGIAVDSSGNVHTTGYFNQTVDFDPGAGTFNITTVDQASFTSKLDSAGNFLWAKSNGGDVSVDIALDSNGNVYTTGYFYGLTDFDPDAVAVFNLNNIGDLGIYISKLNSNGGFVWAKALDGNGTIPPTGDSFKYSYGIAVDSIGNVYTTGEFDGIADFDPGAATFNLTNPSVYTDAYISKLDTDGNFVWAKSLSGMDYTSGRAITLDSQGNVYTTGAFDGTGDFDPGTGTANLTSLGDVDVFISKLENKLSTFADVPTSYWANSYIERLYGAGITGGCSNIPLNYCPDSTVTRAQMAIFLLKGIHGSSYAPPAVNGNTNFGDVATDYWAAAWIKQLAAEGITGGCGGGNYCPDNTVTRAQMAVFLMKAKNGSSYSPPAVGSSTGFGDVATNYWAAAFIKQLVADSITAGCGNGNYCPEDSVTRAQMAVFLVKAFNLP